MRPFKFQLLLKDSQNWVTLSWSTWVTSPCSSSSTSSCPASTSPPTLPRPSLSSLRLSPNLLRQRFVVHEPGANQSNSTNFFRVEVLLYSEIWPIALSLKSHMTILAPLIGRISEQSNKNGTQTRLVAAQCLAYLIIINTLLQVEILVNITWQQEPEGMSE